MAQINFLKSRRKSRVIRNQVVTLAVITIILCTVKVVPLASRPSHKTRTVSNVTTSIPLLVAAPSPSRMDRLEKDLRNRSSSEPAFLWSQSGSDVEITLPSDSLFQIGSAAFDAKRESELRELVQWLNARNEGLQITIESHTDDTPIVKHRKTFKTNWELSAARAGAVAGVFQDLSFPKSKLEAIGFSDSRPVGADRNLNRRIVLRLRDQEQGGT